MSTITLVRCIEASLAAVRQQISLAAEAADDDPELRSAWVAVRSEVENIEHDNAAWSELRRIAKRRSS